MGEVVRSHRPSPGAGTGNANITMGRTRTPNTVVSVCLKECCHQQTYGNSKIDRTSATRRQGKSHVDEIATGGNFEPKDTNQYKAKW